MHSSATNLLSPKYRAVHLRLGSHPNDTLSPMLSSDVSMFSMLKYPDSMLVSLLSILQKSRQFRPVLYVASRFSVRNDTVAYPRVEYPQRRSRVLSDMCWRCSISIISTSFKKSEWVTSGEPSLFSTRSRRTKISGISLRIFIITKISIIFDKLKF